jgi:ABC-type cobalamin transport system permease subunit
MLVRRSSQAALTLLPTLEKKPSANNRLTPDTACAPRHDSTRWQLAIPRTFSDMLSGCPIAILSAEQGERTCSS